MTIVLQVLFALMVALIAIHIIGWVIRKVYSVWGIMSTPAFCRGVYASAALFAFVLSFHEVSRVASFQ